MRKYVKVDTENKVVEVMFASSESAYTKLPDVYQSDEADLEWVRYPDGTFGNKAPAISQQDPIEQIASLRADNLVLMDAIATLYEVINTKTGGVV